MLDRNNAWPDGSEAGSSSGSQPEITSAPRAESSQPLRSTIHPVALSVRPSDIYVSDAADVDTYQQGLQLVSSYSQRDGCVGKVLRVDPQDVPPETLRKGLAWLYSKLESQSARYVGDPTTTLTLAEGPRLLNAWRALCALRASGTARRAGASETWRVQLREDGALLLPAACRAQQLEVQLEGFVAAYGFQWRAEQEGAPWQLDLLSRRQARRVHVSTRVRAELSWHGPEEQSFGGEFPVCDVSRRGLALALNAAEQMIFPGQRLRGVCLRWKGGVAVRCDATVAHVSPGVAGGLDRCGLILEFPGSPAEEQRWDTLIDSLLHPRTVLARIPARTLLSAYRGSGYLKLSNQEPQDFLAQVAHFTSAHKRLRSAPNVGACVAAGDGTRLEAFCHQLQMWPSSWLFYHLCRLPEGRSLGGSDDQVLVDLYSRAYDYISQQGCAWFVTYIQVNAGYSHRVHYQGALEILHLGGVSVTTVQVLQIQCSTPVCEVQALAKPASGLQAAELQSALQSRYPQEYLQAMGLAEPDLGLAALEQSWQAAGLQRLRQVVVVERAGRIVAAGVFDAASPGLHLYGLLDCARVFVLEPGAEQYTSEVLDAAVSWYKQLGREHFVYFREQANTVGFEHLQREDWGEAYVICQAARHIPLLLERVFSLAAPTLVGVPQERNSQTHSLAPSKTSARADSPEVNL